MKNSTPKLWWPFEEINLEKDFKNQLNIFTCIAFHLDTFERVLHIFLPSLSSCYKEAKPWNHFCWRLSLHFLETEWVIQASACNVLLLSWGTVIASAEALKVQIRNRVTQSLHRRSKIKQRQKGKPQKNNSSPLGWKL